MRKIAKQKQGYVSLFGLFIIVIIFVVTCSYGWQKFQEHKFPEKAAKGEIRGVEYYFQSIRQKIKENIERRDIRGKRALEIVANTVIVQDKENLVSFEIPDSWTIEQIQKAPGEISSWRGQSGYFKSHEIEEGEVKKISYDAGAQLTLSVVKGENKKTAD